MQQLVLWACAVAVLGAATWVTVIDADQPTVAPAARRAFIDPQTGEIGPPSAKQREAMQEPPAARAQRRTQDDSAPRVIQRNGVTMVTVPRQTWPERHATVGPEGEIAAPAHD